MFKTYIGSHGFDVDVIVRYSTKNKKYFEKSWESDEMMFVIDKIMKEIEFNAMFGLTKRVVITKNKVMMYNWTIGPLIHLDEPLKFIEDCIDSLDNIHKRGVIHFDIHMGNIGFHRGKYIIYDFSESFEEKECKYINMDKKMKSAKQLDRDKLDETMEQILKKFDYDDIEIKDMIQEVRVKKCNVGALGH